MPKRSTKKLKAPARSTAVWEARPQWQKDQGRMCGCSGTDDFCACQNEQAPWLYGLAGDGKPGALSD